MTTLRPIDSPEPNRPRRLQRPWQVYAMVMIWAIKGFQELLSGALGTSFWAYAGKLSGYSLQVAVQSVFFSMALATGCFYVMAATWLGKRPARTWGIVVALASEIALLALLLTRPPEYGGQIPLVRTVLTGSIVNLGIVGFLLFDGRLLGFLGSPPLVGWWSPRR
ncbi:MAG: hypothetical protein ACM3PF_00415 [Bacteroidota bacterium]